MFIEMKKLVIGLDFGSDSARAALIDSGDGHILATSSMNYPLWQEGKFCDASKSQYRQSPSDYLCVLSHILTEVIKMKPSDSEIVAIGVDTTASTPCMLDKDFKFIADDDPDAMFILWKDHTGIDESKHITEVSQKYLSHSGGVYSAENYWSKVLHVVEKNEAVASKAFYAIEQCDFIPWVLTGNLRPSRCAATCKQMWDSRYGFPPVEYFNQFGEKMAELAANLPENTYLSQEICGALSTEWAKKLNLGGNVIVSVGNIDAHSGAVGAGCSMDTMVLNLGTSACIMAVGPHQEQIKGVFAQAEDIIIPGYSGYEMGLSSFGDNFAWVSRMIGKSIASLSDEASSIENSNYIPLCTDWFNGRRTPSPDSSASASILGLTMSTTPAELFWGIVEGSCFGIKAIIDHLSDNGVRPEHLVAIGGVSLKSPFIMQMLADVTGREIEVSSAKESCAQGAAMNAAVAAGLYGNLQEAQKAMCQPLLTKYCPRKGCSHDERYQRYRELYNLKKDI